MKDFMHEETSFFKIITRKLPLIILIIVVSLIIFGVYFFSSLKEQEKTDKRNCLLANPPHNIYYLLIDKTDLFAKEHEGLIKIVIDDLVEELKFSDEMFISILNKAKTNQIVNLLKKERQQTEINSILPVSSDEYINSKYNYSYLNENIELFDFNFCKPKQKKEANIFYQNQRLIDVQYNNNFIKPIDKIFEVIVQEEKNNISPIVEWIYYVYKLSIKQRQKYSPNIKIILISDMLQNSTLYTHYKDNINFEKFQNTTINKNYNFLNFDYSELEMQVFYLRRKEFKNFQNTQQINFWQDFFKYTKVKHYEIF